MKTGSIPRLNSRESLGDLTKGRKKTEQDRQHGFMLFVTCVLSFTAFLFTVDFSSQAGDALNQPRGIAARQAEGSAAAPARQQSTPAPQPMRAILMEAIAAKIKTVWLGDGNAALLTKTAELHVSGNRSAEAAQIFQPLPASRGHFGSARAPPENA
ncbi:hypothetical protein GJU94_00595 [Brucella sp. 10RB9214]|uniref:hypothetical protein n=1 Tax=unclassified Brucella TaxID=2632610 RepID=UPI000972CD5A|nr:hypothetical protein [Brucella sp. 09RB8910]APY14572.1 hypothetical protein BKD02_10170 [Brucella sp. 09RB8910]MRN45693.1 hypothetical protein [Brucella sp. 10RB9212]MRN48339.1 hypothetical protein [Brucella sp. 10RB9214]